MRQPWHRVGRPAPTRAELDDITQAQRRLAEVATGQAVLVNPALPARPSRPAAAGRLLRDLQLASLILGYAAGVPVVMLVEVDAMMLGWWRDADSGADGPDAATLVDGLTELPDRAKRLYGDLSQAARFVAANTHRPARPPLPLVRQSDWAGWFPYGHVLTVPNADRRQSWTAVPNPLSAAAPHDRDGVRYLADSVDAGRQLGRLTLRTSTMATVDGLAPVLRQEGHYPIWTVTERVPANRAAIVAGRQAGLRWPTSCRRLVPDVLELGVDLLEGAA
jgi:hypothetical protein